MLHEIKQTQKDKCYRILHAETRKGGTRRLLFTGYRVSIWGDEKVQEAASRGAYVTLGMYLIHICFVSIKKLGFPW